MTVGWAGAGIAGPAPLERHVNIIVMDDPWPDGVPPPTWTMEQANEHIERTICGLPPRRAVNPGEPFPLRPEDA